MRIKNIIGIVLVVLSMIGIIFWESRGREMFMMTSVLAAARDISAGETVRASDLTQVSLPKTSLPERSLDPSAASAVSGMTASVNIRKNEPVAAEDFVSENEILLPGQSILTIPDEWICSRPAALAKGDRISVYSVNGDWLGNFKIAYLLDSEELSIKEPLPGENVLDRSGNGIIKDVEIICRTAEYFRILNAVEERRMTQDHYGYTQDERQKCLILVIEDKQTMFKEEAIEDGKSADAKIGGKSGK